MLGAIDAAYSHVGATILAVCSPRGLISTQQKPERSPATSAWKPSKNRSTARREHGELGCDGGEESEPRGERLSASVTSERCSATRPRPRAAAVEQCVRRCSTSALLAWTAAMLGGMAAVCELPLAATSRSASPPSSHTARRYLRAAAADAHARDPTRRRASSPASTCRRLWCVRRRCTR